MEPDEIDALARLARAGDRDALEELLAAVRPRTLAICRGVLRHAHEDAEDACQEALLRVTMKIAGWNGQGRFTTWLHVVAVNAARSMYRRQRGQPVACEESLDKPEPRTTGDIASTRLDLVVALKRLEEDHPQQVEPLVLRLVHDLAYDDIAQRLGVPIGTVKAQVHHGRRFIQRIESCA